MINYQQIAFCCNILLWLPKVRTQKIHHRPRSCVCVFYFILFWWIVLICIQRSCCVVAWFVLLHLARHDWLCALTKALFMISVALSPCFNLSIDNTCQQLPAMKHLNPRIFYFDNTIQFWLKRNKIWLIDSFEEKVTEWTVHHQQIHQYQQHH